MALGGDDNLEFEITADASGLVDETDNAAKSVEVSLGKVEDAIEQTAKKFDEVGDAASDSFGEVESAGKEAARGLNQSADDMISEIDATARAVAAMRRELGEDFRVDSREAVRRLKEMGLTAEQIEADAESLAQALRRIDEVELRATKAGFTDIGQAVKGVNDDTDRADDAMRGFVGGAVGELPGVSSAIGPVAEGLGQVVEGALEGQLSLGKMAAAAGGIAAVGFAVQQINKHFETQAKIDAFNEQQVEDYTDALLDADSAIEGINDKLRQNEGVQINLFGDEVDITEPLADAGFTLEQFGQLIESGSDGLEQWQQNARAAGVETDTVKLITLAAGKEIKAYEEAQRNAAVNARFFANSQDDVARAVDDFIKKSEPIAQFPEEFKRIAAALRDGATPALDDMNVVTEGLNITNDEAISLAYELASATETTTVARNDAADAADEYRRKIEEERAALLEERDASLEAVDAIEAARDARRAAADATFAARDAQDKLNETAVETQKILDDESTSQSQRQQALDDTVLSAARLADEQQRVAEQTAEANGAALTAVETQDLWNESVLQTAASLAGPQRDALLDYLADVNDIPAITRTNIEAAIASGDLTRAKRLLEEASADRTAIITADAETEQAERELEALRTKERIANIRAVVTAGPNAEGVFTTTGGNSFRDRGGVVPSGGVVIAGENRPEYVNGTLVTRPTLVQGPANIDSGESSNARLGDGGGTTNNYVTINTTAGTTPSDVIDYQRRFQQRNGRSA